MKQTNREAREAQRPFDRATKWAVPLAAGMLTSLIVACSPLDNQTGAVRRPLDTKPVRIHLQTSVPPGRAEAFFELDTGGDQMTQRPKEAGLIIVVRVGIDEYRQTIASCHEPSLGSALGGGTERELEVAICDGEYWLVSEPGSVSVVRMDRKPGGEPITRFDLPDRVRAVSPQNK